MSGGDGGGNENAGLLFRTAATVRPRRFYLTLLSAVGEKVTIAQLDGPEFSSADLTRVQQHVTASALNSKSLVRHRHRRLILKFTFGK